METKKKVLLVVGVVGVGVAAYYLLAKKLPVVVVQDEGNSSTSSSGNTLPASPVAPIQAVLPQAQSCPFPQGTLLRAGNDAKVFLVNEQCQKQWITTRKKLESMGHSMNNVQSVSSGIINSIPSGANLSGLGCAYKYLS